VHTTGYDLLVIVCTCEVPLPLGDPGLSSSSESQAGQALSCIYDQCRPTRSATTAIPGLGVGTPESVRKWVRQAEIDAGSRGGITSEESAEVRRLKRENAELKRANAILKAAAAFFGAELDRPSR